MLWCAIKKVQREMPDLEVVVYTGDVDSPAQIIARAQVRCSCMRFDLRNAPYRSDSASSCVTLLNL